MELIIVEIAGAIIVLVLLGMLVLVYRLLIGNHNISSL